MLLILSRVGHRVTHEKGPHMAALPTTQLMPGLYLLSATM